MSDCFLSTIKDFVPQWVGHKEDKLTHSSLCTLGANWLIRNHKCRAVLIERGCGGGEMPDVLGFYYDDSFLMEAKASRSDFLADAKKPHRIDGAMGKYRYYICPKNLIKPDEIPAGWGLLYVTEGGMIKRQVSALPLGRDKDREYVMLTSALASPWKLFQHWADTNIQRLARVNWMSKTMDADLKLFCARLAVNRLNENEDAA